MLVPCPSCARHVRLPSPACPFCASALPEDLGARAVPAAGRRLERLAAFTFAATFAATACGGQTDSERGSTFDGGASSSGDNGGGQPVYGMPAPDPTGTTAPAYGMPPEPIDAGAAKDGGDAGDGG